MIGVEENAHFNEIEFQLNRGDFLLLTSDGLIEAECMGDVPFGVEGIEEFLANYQGYDLIQDLIRFLYNKSKYVEFTDDISMIKIELTGDESPG
jgi:serine phosphatase RsbU (regulator of sigma subunit)